MGQISVEIPPESGSVLSATQHRAGGVQLKAENPAYAGIDVSEDRAFEIWGVVTKSIRMLT